MSQLLCIWVNSFFNLLKCVSRKIRMIFSYSPKKVKLNFPDDFSYTFVSMKRILASFLLCFYLFPAIGFSVNVHWCCDKISAVSFLGIQTDKCKTCQKTNKPKRCCHKAQLKRSCCQTSQLTVRITDRQNCASSTETNDYSLKQVVSFISVNPFLSSFALSQATFANYHSPPTLGKQPVYLTINVFRV